MPHDGKIDTRIELLATLLLSLPTIATAWSVYEAARWSGVQATEFSRRRFGANDRGLLS